ncbi:hypothetical protein BGX27_001222, partial [Mortierella sp. AM989]
IASSNIERTPSNDQSFHDDPKDPSKDIDYNNNVGHEINGTWSALKKHVKWALDVIA